MHVFPQPHSGPCVWQLKQTGTAVLNVFVSLFKLQMVQNFILVQITKRFPNKADNCLFHFHPVFKTWSSHFKNYIKRQSFRSGKLKSSDLTQMQCKESKDLLTKYIFMVSRRSMPLPF